MKRKYYVKIMEGLGNQMFQYAWARAMQKQFGGVIVIDPHSYGKEHIRSLSLQNLMLNDEVRINNTTKEKILTYAVGAYKKIIDFFFRKKNEMTYVKKAHLGIYEQISTLYYNSYVKPRCAFNYFEGDWMGEMWFKIAEEEIRHDMLVKTPPTEKNKQLLKEIQSCNSVCIHIRLGDLLQEPYNTRSRVCGNAYYNEAIRIIKEKVDNPVFYLFTNRPKDFEYINKNYSFDADVIPVNYGNPDYEDLRLMYSCKHQIMSNSTFSWWAQYLNSNPSKVIVAPCMFNKHNNWNLQSLFMDYFELVGPEFLLLEGMTCTQDVNTLSPKIPWQRVIDANKN